MTLGTLPEHRRDRLYAANSGTLQSDILPPVTPDPLLRPLGHLFAHPYAGVLSAAAVLSTLCFLGGVALLGSSHVAGYLYAASMAIGTPVLVALRPWQASVSRSVRLYAAAYLGFFVFCAVEVLVRGATPSVLDGSGRLLLGLSNGFFFFLLLERQRDALFSIIVLLAAAHASVAVLSTLGKGIDLYDLTLGDQRLGGHAARAIPFALMHISSLGIVVLAVVDKVRPDSKLWPLLIALLLTSASLLASVIGGSRGPLLAMPLLFVLAAAMVWMRLGPRWGNGILGVGVAGFMVTAGLVFQRDPQSLTLVYDLLFGTWDEDWTTSNAGIRLELWRLSLQLIPEAPFLGHGLAAWPEVLRHPSLGLAPDAYILNFGHPHNEYLNLLVKVGIVGTALFFAPMFIALAGIRRMTATPSRRIHAVVIAWFVGAHLIYGVTDLYSEWTTNMLFLGVFLGMLIWLVPGRDEGRAQAAP